MLYNIEIYLTIKKCHNQTTETIGICLDHLNKKIYLIFLIKLKFLKESIFKLFKT